MADDRAAVVGCSMFFMFGGAIITMSYIQNCEGLKNVSTLKTETAQKDENRSLLKATFMHDLEDFKKAL